MSTTQPPIKAYQDQEFINSPDARTIRILAEYLGPLRQFRREKIKDTIVFFGSARVVPKDQAEKEYRELRLSLRNSLQSQENFAKLDSAKRKIRLSRYYEDAVELARLITAWSLSLGEKSRRFVVCSGGGPGIMEAANRGSRLAGGKTIGLNISLPFEQLPNPYISEELSFEFHYFFMRKYWFVYLAKALIIFPGGFGTLDELMEVLTLVQTRKINKNMVVLLYGSTYWKEVLDFGALVRWGTISKEDLGLFQFADSAPEAFKIVKEGLEKYYLDPQVEKDLMAARKPTKSVE
ncbi:MAG: lysine decarboxylase [Acidobacteria bacterium]|nr:MAG: lysine decarboxylase [Acidobacteriota bacterium]